MKKMIARLIGFFLNLEALISSHTAGRRGFFLFCTPIAPPVKVYHRKFLDTARQEHFEFEGIRIQTYAWGHGPKKILFLHGWQSHSFRWKNYIESFSKEDYTLYALDAPAHGLSGGKYINLPLYSRVMVHFIRRVHPVHAVISHSFGSFAMLHSFYRVPDLPVERLVITGTPGEADDFMQFYRQVLGLWPRTMKVVLDYFVKEIRETPAFFSAARFAGAVPVPGLIIHDEKDDETPYHYATQIHAAWPTSKLITTSGLGHNLKSADVIRWVREFVSEGERVSNLS